LQQRNTILILLEAKVPVRHAAFNRRKFHIFEPEAPTLQLDICQVAVVMLLYAKSQFRITLFVLSQLEGLADLALCKRYPFANDVHLQLCVFDPDLPEVL
jgi:hypothetical protein